MTAADLRTSIDRLLGRVRPWEPARWARPPARAETMFTLVQHLADLGADAEGRERRRVPRAGDLVLPDQLRVMADDLLAAGTAETWRAAVTAVETARRDL